MNNRQKVAARNIFTRIKRVLEWGRGHVSSCKSPKNGNGKLNVGMRVNTERACRNESLCIREPVSRVPAAGRTKSCVRFSVLV